VASSPEEVRGAWQKHFAKIEVVTIMPFAQVAKRCKTKQQKTPLPQLNIDNVPPVTELGKTFAKTRKGKAMGEWNVPCDLLRMFPALIAQTWHPLLAKAALRVEEPIHMKGGTFVELYKGKGLMSICNNSRSILGVGRHI
jgi:hypothetical protein